MIRKKNRGKIALNIHCMLKKVREECKYRGIINYYLATSTALKNQISGIEI